MATLFLHIGTHKTGSTYLQNYLKLNEARLQEQGWSYPTFIDPANHRGLAFVFHEKITPLYEAVGLGSPAALAAEKQRWADGLSKHVKPDSKWIITSEFFSHRLRNAEQVQALIDFLRQWFDKIIVVAYVRRQEYIAPSVYSQNAKAGRRREWSWAYCQKRLVSDDYNTLYDLWNDREGVEEVRVAPYLEANKADTRAILNQFTELTGIEFPRDCVEPPTLKANRSLSVEGIAFLWAINPHLPMITSDGQSGRAFRAQVIEQVMDLTPGPTFNPADEVIEEIHRHFLDSNRAFIDKLPRDPRWDEWLAQPTHNDKPQALIPRLSAERTAELVIALSEPDGIVAWGRPDKRRVQFSQLAKQKVNQRLRKRKRSK